MLRPLSPLQVEIPRLPSTMLKTGCYASFGCAQDRQLGMTYQGEPE